MLESASLWWDNHLPIREFWMERSYAKSIHLGDRVKREWFSPLKQVEWECVEESDDYLRFRMVREDRERQL
jgi:hypothetical protein